ncbi:class I SAM-dependent methyltransferase [Leptospira borgpetersenii serovar Hardjo-bovis]|uniref:class I SAM-dependent methyltransferase n=1 Tax=Leptospira borgpetersenii TaxID=174 RepID=UPI0000E578F8|nr:class I SAM-dependent methyltransferase [Leptospira borgpetersenii]ABJ79987.1 Ubiquinone/menaquinone biosynthesis methyltransferase [Leptospira borgpetersenii serovar Hardjo-bovis str. L550]AMX59414.1 SAM-dependent methyltransferase [Leptospira borgpetersenii serovar Hardjo]AMX62642.1 SAM-dependent methyltransferase [Leptospira borgpetersenii serovar Hardjo]AMX65885.1 SAM-dependent methyltransferase [Leptospira borgpetersenii serovar Hardjo]AMX69118.1 SAM-dependent methyltransferase [Leptos
MILSGNFENQRRFFDLFSKSYGFMEILTFGFANRARKRFLKILDLTNDGIVCDLMCGNGNNIGILRKNFRCKRIIGVDVSSGMIQVARDRFGEENIFYVTENALASSIPSSHCDFVTCSFGLKTLRPEQRILLIDEVYRILKPSGTFVFMELSKPVGFVSVFWKFYFLFFLPWMARLFSYPFVRKKYLMDSISDFGSIFSEEEFCRKVFSKLKFFRWYGGIVTGVLGEKMETP